MNYLYFLQNLRESSPEFVSLFFVFVSEILLKFSYVLLGVIYWCINKDEGTNLIFGYGTAFSFNQFIKNIACVYRPWIKDSRLHIAKQAAKSATGYSFPSGHTVTASSVFGGIAYKERKNKGVCILFSILVLLTAFSRNWLGAHTLYDVSFAILEGIVFVAIIDLLSRYLKNHPEKDLFVLICGIFVSIAVLVFQVLKSYPVDYDAAGAVICDPALMKTDCFSACGITCGSLIGWFIERHFIKFEVSGSKKQKIIRGCSGSVFTLGILVLSGTAFKFTGSYACHFIKYFLTFITITCIVPLFIKIIHKD